ncbi:hypothetical protein GCM10009670_30170 [Citricoccus alkalitolerans]
MIHLCASAHAASFRPSTGMGCPSPSASLPAPGWLEPTGNASRNGYGVSAVIPVIAIHASITGYAASVVISDVGEHPVTG